MVELLAPVPAEVAVTVETDMRTSLALHHLFAACRFASIVGQAEQEHAGCPVGAFWEEILHNALGVAALAVIFLESYADYLVEEGSVLAPRRELAVRPGRRFAATDGILDKFAAALSAHTGKPLDYGAVAVRNVDTLIRLRNEVVRLRPPGVSGDGEVAELAADLERCFSPSMFFANEPMLPRAWASHEFALWALQSTVAFMDYIYAQLGIPSPLDKHRVELTALCGRTL